MKTKTYIFSIFILSLVVSCKTYEPLDRNGELILKGKLVDENDEELFHIKIYESNSLLNYTYTDLDGNFKLKLIGNYPIARCDGFPSDPFYFKLDDTRLNKIVVGKGQEKSSKKVCKRFLRSKKRDYKKFNKSINGDWVVKNTVLKKDSDWEKRTSNYTRETFRKVFGVYFLGGLKKDDTITIKRKRIWIINNDEKRKYFFKSSPAQFSFVEFDNKSRGEYDYWSVRYERVNSNTLVLFLHGNYSEYEWWLERKEN